MKGTSIIILVVGIILSGGIVLAAMKRSPAPIGGEQETKEISNGEQVKNEDGKQVIEIIAKGGYSPRKTIAKANIPTVLRVRTNGTYDCSSALSIPLLGVRENLPPSGVKEYVIPAQQPGAVLQATCSMGMYSFQISFE